MCGIAGILGTITPGDSKRVAAMVRRLRHRGPDASRVEALDGAVLGHSRLSIIDLSDAGLQPMTSGDGRHVIVFNGEIYNYVELREELHDRYPFRTHTDTEVLIAAYQVWGESCLDRLIGMFAFCIYDPGERTAFLARDRFGQKPLLLHETGGTLLFASEVKALLAAGVEARPDLDVWRRYLNTASYDDTVETFFAGITQLQPGECARWDGRNGLRRRRYYWLPDVIVGRSMSFAEATEETRRAMVEAARIHMRADVPVGIMLSGGLDSSALLASLDLGGTLNPGVKCFSVEFGEDLSEARWIKPVAAHHGVPSRIDRFTNADYLESLQPMMWDLEGPIGGLITCALRAVMAAAREDGYVVLQQGTGPDEAFGGYRNHHNAYLGHLIRSGAPEADAAVAAYAANWGVSPEAARAGALAELERSVTAIDGTVPVRPDLLSSEMRLTAVDSSGSRFPSPDPVLSSLMDYVQGSKVPRNMRFLDRLSMAFSIELRLPLLDHRLVEMGLSMPQAYWFHCGRSKGVIREAFKGAMDEEARLAVKRSIQAPQGMWLRSPPMSGFIDDLIASRSFAERGVFEVARVGQAWNEFKKGLYDNSFFVWQWINFELWCRTFLDRKTTFQNSEAEFPPST